MRAQVWLSAALVGTGLALAAAAPGDEAARPAPDVEGARGAPDVGAGYVGQAVCSSCHAVEASHWEPTAHGRLLSERTRLRADARGCESCHGPGARHVQDPTDRSRIVAFTRRAETPVETMNGMCLGCHAGGARIHWPGSRHESQDLACSDCHDPMARHSARGLQAARSVSEACFRCHPQQRMEFRKRSHMPLLEGKISCADCHEPHGSPTDPLLHGDSVNQLCFSCHAEKRGPFVWEHPPVVESCMNCHTPHGSNHESLLVATPPFLCQQCHANPGSFSHANDPLTRGNLAMGTDPDERALGKACVNCHVRIHGSSHPSGARFHR